MSLEKGIRGKHDQCHHEGKRSELRRIGEAESKLKEYMREEGIKRNPDWFAFRDRSNRKPNQFGGIGDNGDGTPLDTPVFFHRDEQGTAIIMPGVNMEPDEIDQLARRGAVFPMETAEPLLATGMREYVDAINKTTHVQKVPEVQKDVQR